MTLAIATHSSIHTQHDERQVEVWWNTPWRNVPQYDTMRHILVTEDNGDSAGQGGI
jgi:hypothetical protein